MRGIIIAGGLGTRLRPLTYTRPKHLLPVANRPFLEYQVALLRDHGVTEIVFATNYFAEKIAGHFRDGSDFGVRMRYAIEDQPLGTAGAIRNAAADLPRDTLLVLNGDILTDFDLRAVLSFHRERGAQATIALRPVQRPHAFGVLATADDGRVQEWREPSEEEKRQVASASGPKTGETDYINAGVYVLEPGVVDSIPADRPVSIERETYPNLIASGASVYGTPPDGFWLDIGHPEQYLLANSAVLTGAVQTTVPFQPRAEETEVDSSARIDASTSLGAGVKVGANSRLTECIMMDGAVVGDGVDLSRVIAEEGVQIGSDVIARGGHVLGLGTTLGRGTRL